MKSWNLWTLMMIISQYLKIDFQFTISMIIIKLYNVFIGIIAIMCLQQLIIIVD